MNLPTIFVTGGGGLLGRKLCEQMTQIPGKIYLLVRNSRPPQSTFSTAQTEEIFGDLLMPKLGLTDSKYTELCRSTTHILHAAANTRFDLTLDEARLANVTTAQKVIAFAKACKNLERVAFVSTAFVAGKRTGLILEDDLEHNFGFLNTYEQSKYEAEVWVRQHNHHLPLIIFRPSLIDDSHALKLCLGLIEKGLLPVIPGRDQDQLDIIKGEVAADWIVRLLFSPKLNNSVFHITQGSAAPTLRSILTSHGLIAKFSKNKIIPPPELHSIYRKLESFLPELEYPKIFDNSHTRQDLQI